MHNYKNGSFLVTIDGNGTRTMEGEIFDADFPCSMDVKITNNCSAPCKWCHEKSNLRGRHAELHKDQYVFSQLPAGVEIAIGGGNPFSHPDLKLFLSYLKSNQLISNITVNQIHLKNHYDEITSYYEKGLIYGLGVSWMNCYDSWMEQIVRDVPTTVIHFILGLHPISIIKDYIQKNPGRNILLLGYKKFGRGVDYYNKEVENNLYRAYVEIHELVKRDVTLCFDNLACEQLNLKRFFGKDQWDTFYQGEDGTISMFIDLVERKFCRSFTEEKRCDVGNKDVIEMFQYIKSEKIKNDSDIN